MRGGDTFDISSEPRTRPTEEAGLVRGEESGRGVLVRSRHDLLREANDERRDADLRADVAELREHAPAQVPVAPRALQAAAEADALLVHLGELRARDHDTRRSTKSAVMTR